MTDPKQPFPQGGTSQQTQGYNVGWNWPTGQHQSTQSFTQQIPSTAPNPAYHSRGQPLNQQLSLHGMWGPPIPSQVNPNVWEQSTNQPGTSYYQTGQAMTPQQTTTYGQYSYPTYGSAFGWGQPYSSQVGAPNIWTQNLMPTTSYGQGQQIITPQFQKLTIGGGIQGLSFPSDFGQTQSSEPEVRVHKKYVDYTRSKRKAADDKSQPMSSFQAYDPFPTPGAPIPFGKKVQDDIEYPAATDLAQGEHGYNLLHLSEESLPEDSKGRRGVYGTHQGDPLQGPAEWRAYFSEWDHIGKRYSQQISKDEALTADEIQFCLKYGFEFIKNLGSGAYGSVWSVKATKLFRNDDTGQFEERLIACKVTNLKRFDKKKETLDIGVGKLLREAEIHQTLDHKNIVKCEHIFSIHDEVTGFPYCRLLLFMELCDGDLHRVLRKSPGQRLTEDTAFGMLMDVVDGLLYLHQHNVVHLDIKPENVMYVNDQAHFYGKCFKLGDFGISKRFPSGAVSHKLRGPVGTRTYMAPELEAARKYKVEGKPADIYSLGCVLLMCTVGKILFPNAIIHFHTQGIPTNAIAAQYHISVDLADLISVLLAYDASYRIPIEEVINQPWVQNRIQMMN